MINDIFLKDEWTQEELYKNSKLLEKEGYKVILIDTILKPIDNIETMTYNPYEMAQMNEKTIFVFYCDTGKTTKERLSFYRKKLPNHKCFSLRGGRGYWRPYFQILEEIQKNV